MGRDPFHQPRALRALSSLALDTAREGTDTASLGNLGQGLTTFTGKNFFLASNLNLPSSSLKPSSLVLSPHALVRSPSAVPEVSLQVLEGCIPPREVCPLLAPPHLTGRPLHFGGQTLCLEPSGWLMEDVMVLGDLRTFLPPPFICFCENLCDVHLPARTEVQAPGLLWGRTQSSPVKFCTLHLMPDIEKDSRKAS